MSHVTCQIFINQSSIGDRSMTSGQKVRRLGRVLMLLLSPPRLHRCSLISTSGSSPTKRVPPPPPTTVVLRTHYCIAPMVNYWSQVCSAQRSRPMSQLLQANYGGGFFAVSELIHFGWVRKLPRTLMRCPGCFFRVCCGVQRDVVGAVGEAAAA